MKDFTSQLFFKYYDKNFGIAFLKNNFWWLLAKTYQITLNGCMCDESARQGKFQ